MRLLSKIQFTILRQLESEAKKAADISGVRLGTLYETLNRMRDRGLVLAKGGSYRKVYAITEKGRQELHKYRALMEIELNGE